MKLTDKSLRILIRAAVKSGGVMKYSEALGVTAADLERRGYAKQAKRTREMIVIAKEIEAEEVS